MTGALVAIVGPSGAGKDTLIAHARATLSARAEFHFARRLVTRAANAFEDHDTIDAAAFDAAAASGAYALCWRAHGLGYALGGDVAEAIRAGRVVICNLSRGALPEARSRFQRMSVVEITAPPEVLAARLAARGRETPQSIAERLQRERAFAGRLRADCVIVNDRPVAETGAALIAHLEGVAKQAALSAAASP